MFNEIAPDFYQKNWTAKILNGETSAARFFCIQTQEGKSFRMLLLFFKINKKVLKTFWIKFFKETITKREIYIRGFLADTIRTIYQNNSNQIVKEIREIFLWHFKMKRWNVYSHFTICKHLMILSEIP